MTASDSSASVRTPVPTSIASPSPTPSPSLSLSPSPSHSSNTRGREEVVSLPDVGTFSWGCSRKIDTLDFRFSTTFSATGATAKVSYSLDGGSWVTKVLQPGMTLSTPFRKATSHTWRIVQDIEPYTTKVTIVATLVGNSFGECLNPEVEVSRVRVSHEAP